MKKNILPIAMIILALAFNAMPQSNEQAGLATPPAANSADVESLDAIMNAVYDVISGDAGKKRDWDRFRSLFHKDARLIPANKNSQTGIIGANAVTPEGYIESSGPYLEKNGFFEKEISRKTDIYGNIAQVFSTYAAFHTSVDKEPFMRGINSFQLLNDGNRWWVLTIYWQRESKEHPIPANYLPKQSGKAKK